MFQDMGKMLVLMGVLLLVLGGVLISMDRFSWAGRLPGDILVRKGEMTFFFPVASCIIISVIASLLLYLLSRR